MEVPYSQLRGAGSVYRQHGRLLTRHSSSRLSLYTLLACRLRLKQPWFDTAFHSPGNSKFYGALFYHFLYGLILTYAEINVGNFENKLNDNDVPVVSATKSELRLLFNMRNLPSVDGVVYVLKTASYASFLVLNFFNRDSEID